MHSAHPAILESCSSIRRAARMCRARTLRREEYPSLSAQFDGPAYWRNRRIPPLYRCFRYYDRCLLRRHLFPATHRRFNAPIGTKRYESATRHAIFPAAPSIGVGRRRRMLSVLHLPSSNGVSISVESSSRGRIRTNFLCPPLGTGGDVNTAPPRYSGALSPIRLAARKRRSRPLRRAEYRASGA